MKVNDFFIWWLSQQDCEILSDHIDNLNFPDYIKENFLSRFGRAGRGRLWTDENISITWGEKVTHKLAENCGGLVCKTSDIDKVIFLPGFVTTLEMEFWIYANDNLRLLQLIERDKGIKDNG